MTETAAQRLGATPSTIDDAHRMDPTTPTTGIADPATAATEVAQPALAGAVGERCATCGAHLRPDQRYCVECGDRRGGPRLPFMDGRPHPVAEPVPAPRRSRRPRASTGLTLIAGVATLLLAMGVGVLIGRSNHDATTASRSTPASVQVVTVPASGQAGTTATTSTAATTAGAAAAGAAAAAAGAKGGKATARKAKAASATSAPTPRKAAAKAPPKTVKIGSKGHGRGFKNGKFTGDFFGP